MLQSQSHSPALNARLTLPRATHVESSHCHAINLHPLVLELWAMPSTVVTVRVSEPPRPLWADVSKLSPTVACPEVQEVGLRVQ